MKRLLVIGTLLACAVVAASIAPSSSRSSTKADCSLARTGLVPLTDMGNRRYRGHRGGLYPAGVNRPPVKYLRRGITASKRIRPIDGKIVLLSIGMSNASDEFAAFKRSADRDPQKNSSLVVVDGAQDGFDSRRARQPIFWETIDERLSEADATPAQVQAVWLKQSVAGEQRPFPRDARGLQSDLRAILRIMRARYPNVKLVYLSSRTYGGYAITGLNPEPAAYDSAYAVRGIIQERIRGQIKGPLLFWGPYLWTDGQAGRNDGLVWNCEDVEEDGTHPSRSGIQKVVTMLTTFFKTDPTTRRWYVARPLAP